MKKVGLWLNGGKVVLDKKFDHRVRMLRAAIPGEIMIEMFNGEKCIAISCDPEEIIVAPFLGIRRILSEGTTAKEIYYYYECED